MDPTAIESYIAQRVADALSEYEARIIEGSGQENDDFCGNNGKNPKPCLYQEFMKSKPKPYYGDGGAIELALWFDNMESAFEASLCTADRKVGFATSTFKDTALLWWDVQVKARGIAAANTMSWETLKIMMVEEYCPRSVRLNLEHEFENLTMQGSDIEAYTNSFSNLATMCPEMVTPEHKKMERYIKGLTPQIRETLTDFRPTTIESVKSIVACFASQNIRQETQIPKPDPPRKDDNKRKRYGNNKDNSNHSSSKKQKTVTTTAMVPSSQRQYTGNLPKCNKCPFHHHGSCRTLFCNKCNKEGHTARYCRSPMQRRSLSNNTGAGRVCFECRGIGHFKKECPTRAIGKGSKE